MTKQYRLETTERSFDHTPWIGDGEEFDSLESCNRRIQELSEIWRANEISLITLKNNKVIDRNLLQRKLY